MTSPENSDSQRGEESSDSAGRLRLVLGGLIFLVLCPFLIADIFWDDFLVIRPDGPIASLATLKTAFFGRCVLFSDAYEYPYYRPMIDSLFILEYAITGTSPFLYHLTNFALHLANGLMLFELIRRVPLFRVGDFAAFLGVGVFALHPIQVESVLWPAARPAVLSLFFALLGIHAIRTLYKVECPLRASLLGFLAIVAFVGSLFSKEIAVAILPPGTLLLLARHGKAPMRVYIVTALLTVVLVAYLLLNRAVSSSATNLGDSGMGKLATLVFQFFGFYLGKLAFPLNLAPAYPAAVLESHVYTIIGLVGTIVCLAIFIRGLIKRDGRSIGAAAGAVLFGGGAVLPVFGGQVAVADRYVYQAVVGLALMIGVGVATLLEMQSEKFKPDLIRKIGFAAVGVLALLSFRQSTFWINSDMVWLHVVDVSPDSIEGNYFVGEFHESRGDMETALKHFERATYPETPSASSAQFMSALKLGGTHLTLGNYQQAIEAYAHAEQYPSLRNDAIVRQAIALVSNGDRGAALETLKRFEDSGSESAGVYTNLALLAIRVENDPKAALGWYEKARNRGAQPIDELEALKNNSEGADP